MSSLRQAGSSAVRLGLWTPVVILLPGAHNHWEVDATAADLLAVARAADDAGFWRLTCSEHAGIPAGIQGVAGPRGTRYWDPWTTLGLLAGATERIRLSTHVLVAPYHQPLEVLKRASTLDRLSAGRLILGIGVGSLEEEFAALDANFESRGAVTDELLDAVLAGWAVRSPRHTGQFFRYDGLTVDPLPVQPDAPIWIGGRTRRSLARALRVGRGWTPFGLTPADVAAMLADPPAEVPDGFDVALVAQPDHGPLDPLTDPEATRDAIGTCAEAGATVVDVRPRSDSADHHADQLRAVAELVN